MGAVEVAAGNEAADAPHGPAGIGEEVQVIKLRRREGKIQLMTPEMFGQ